MEERNVREMNKRTNYFDFSLLFIIIFLLCFGLVMLYSTSSYNALLKYGSSTFFLKKQIIASIVGLVVMAFFTFVDYHIWRRFYVLIYIASLVAIVLVVTPLGMTVNGARRWIGVGSLSIQPAEAAKLAIIIFLAVVISRNARKLGNFAELCMVLALAIPPAGFIAVITKNLSSAIIVAGIAVVMLFVASPKYKPFIITGIVGIATIAAFLLLGSGFRLNRVMVWLNPEKYSQDGGYQVLQGLYAIGSGGLFGKGLGQSVQKLGFVPEAQNDMIFTIICEELGLFGAVAIILLFLFMLRRFMIIAQNAPDLYGTMIVIGVMAHIAIQVVLNIAVVTNSIPNTGITLPFISYGGTSVVFLMAEMGLVLSVSRQIRAIR